MSITKKLEKEDALLIARALNKEFPHFDTLRDKWPVLILEKDAYEEYQKYRRCSLEITFQQQPKSNQFRVTIKGHVHISRDDEILFTDFDPHLYVGDQEGALLLENLTALLRKFMSEKRQYFLSKASELTKLAKSGIVI